VIRDGRFDVLCHLAAQIDVRKSVLDPTYDARINILGTLNQDGNLHFLPEAKDINRDLALSLNRNLAFEQKDLGPDGSLEVQLGNRWYPS